MSIDVDALEREYRHYEADGLADIGDNRVLLLIAELRAARKVVEAAREYRRRTDLDGKIGFLAAEFDAALAEADHSGE